MDFDERRNRSKSTANDYLLSSNDSVICSDKERNNSGSSRQPYHPSRHDSIISASIDSAHSSPTKTKTLKKIQTLWYTIKRFSPVHRVKSTCNKKKLSEKSQRLYASHPDISYGNLVVLTQLENRSRDDTDALRAHASGTSNSSVKNTFTMNPFDNQYNTEHKQINSIESDNEVALNRQRISILRQHPFYHLEVHLVCAKNLLAKDVCGTSDPYVKFKIGNRIVYKSRIVPKCLDPKWDEHFVIPIEDVFQPIHIRAYDHDFGFQDDFLGAASIDLTKLDISKPTDLVLNLTETGLESDTQSWGQLFLTITLKAKTQEEKEMHFSRGTKTVNVVTGSETSVKKLKTQLWDSVVNVILVEGKDILLKDENNSNEIHIRFKLGTEKYKSRVIPRVLNPVWSEQFDLHTYPDQSKVLEISMFGRDEIGKCSLNLNDLAKEETHNIWITIGPNCGAVLLLISISGTLGSETISDLNAHEDSSEEHKSLVKKYSLLRSLNEMDDIGVLIVKVFRAESLAAADIGGKSDPFCVLELVNTRLQTNTEYKTLSPEWNKIYCFNIKDIHSVLEITVYDEDRDKKVEFLGKVAIPLLKINNQEKKWFALKDKKLLGRAKGQILLEMNVYYNKIKASIRTFNPRETKFIKPEQRFKRMVFIRNVSRLKTLIMEVYEILKFMNSCFQWESVSRSIIALALFLVITYFFELYMAPILILLLFIKSYIWIKVENYFNQNNREEEIDEFNDTLFDEEDDETKNEEKKSLKEKLQTVQEITTIIQNVIGEIASAGERIKNTFNFSVPFLSWLAIISLSIITVVLYYIPLRYLIMVWGINKFTKKLRSPNAINNNELLDFLSRVPDIDEKMSFREYKVHTNSQITNTESDRKKKKKFV